MKHETLLQAFNELDDRYIAEATKKKRSPIRWAAPIAAVLAVAILATTLLRSPGGITIDHGIQQNFLVAKPEYPKMAAYPLIEGEGSYEVWWEEQRAFYNQPEGYADALEPFWEKLLTATTTDNKENAVCSPVNIYMALSMLAQITGGNTRQEILDVLNAESMDSLATQANHVWEGHYKNDGLSTCILATSLWLEENYGFKKETADLLAKNFYASVFRGDMDSEKINEALAAWLDEQTGGLLKRQLGNFTLPADTVLALVSTIYYKVQWLDEFQEKNNTQATFHGTTGNTRQTFLNRTLPYGPYYWSDSFGAIYLPLEDGSRMWLILPDEGVDPGSIWGEVRALLSQDPIYADTTANSKRIKVHLSVPKFDIGQSQDLSKALQKLGITEVFTPQGDFSPILKQPDGGYVSQVNHAARVAIDEKGVTAAAFTDIKRAGAAPPPEEEIYFTLDRPFLFYIESEDDLPLFAGIVNAP